MTAEKQIPGLRPEDETRPLRVAYIIGNTYAMNRTSLFLDEETIKRIQKLARARGVSFASLVREALAQYVADAEPAMAVPSIAGRFASGEIDTSERADELLWHNPHE